MIKSKIPVDFVGNDVIIVDKDDVVNDEYLVDDDVDDEVNVDDGSLFLKG